ncbi:MAG: hypothetical protein R8P61_27900 [Bacteroidia bacterium]|nr:hypothetical protein [Bacteroidia bacterium]
MKHNHIRSYSFGKRGLQVLNFFGAALFVLSLLAWGISYERMETLPLFPAILTVLGLGLLLSRTGVKVDPGGDRYKYYFRFLALTFGSWKSLKTYGEVVLLRSKYQKQKARYRPENVVYNLYLGTQNHLKLLFISSIQSLEKAELEALQLALLFKRDWVEYNPGFRRPRRILGNASTAGLAIPPKHP